MISELFVRLFKAVFYPLLLWRKPQVSGVWDFHQAQGIVGIPFGSHEDGDEIGASNLAIVRVMEEAKKHEDRLRYGDKPMPKMVAQWEMTDADPAPVLDYVIGKRGDYHISTYKFFCELKKKYPEWHTIIVVAHPDHIWRVIRIARKFGFNALVPEGIDTIPYDLESRQPWCRYKWKFPFGIWAGFKSPENWPFMLWEPLARIHHAVKGWI